MNLYGIEVNIKNTPELDPEFLPMEAFKRAFLETADKPFVIAVERNDGLISRFYTKIHGTKEMFEADCYFAERILKFILWSKGGYKAYICGDENVAEYISKQYSPDGKRSFDYNFMTRIYENQFEIISLPIGEAPVSNEKSKPAGRHLDGYRIGFDAGGSDRKVSAVASGKVLYSEEVVWSPKTQEDPGYHFNGIVEAFKTAASKMPRVDAIGVSSAGVYVDNKTMAASLFIKVPEDKFNEQVKDIYIRAAKEIGNIPLTVANDGDVTALAGAMSLDDNKVLGIAMGTSQAGGYVDESGNITGWLNELAFAPVDANPNAAVDEWSKDIGCGVKYFSQDGVIKLAKSAGIEIDENLQPSKNLKIVQELVEKEDSGALKIFTSIGTYLGHSIAFYSNFYDINHVLLLGRVMSGKGGNLIFETANKVIKDEYANISGFVKIHLPDEKNRRVGQSVAAASLPEIYKVLEGITV